MNINDLTKFSAPLRLGHRGCRKAAGTDLVENTLPAIDWAIAQGCEGVEIDLHQTADGVWVLHHDDKCQQQAIAGTPYRQLLQLHPQLTTLEAVLERHGGKCWFDFEVKCTAGEASLSKIFSTCRLPLDSFVVSSFSRRWLERLYRQAPHLPLCYNLRARRRLHGLPWRWVAPHWTIASNGYLARLHRQGWRTIVWTVNHPARMRRLARAGAAVIISDDPGLLCRTLSGSGTLISDAEPNKP